MTQLIREAVCGTVKEDLSQHHLTRYTASELIARTQIARSTFYQYFDGGLRDVFLSTIQQDILRPIMHEEMAWEQAVDFVLDYVRHNQTFVDNLYELGSGPAKICWLRQALVEAIWPQYRARLADQQILRCWHQLNLLCGALVSELQCWTCSGHQEDWHQVRTRLLSFEVAIDR
ncbi:hypothetical protein [Lapidilactobacillus luobeiensis]|uniref:hypothetical protein n=1 Tax=Lapidilactobacillus luobeiensis TaxID=2950371 RepID=UPI0021C4A15D|nr:hypothetical protein [Lapidilactobacillus luobeiensis]